MIIVGIDPGLDGAIAILRSDTMQLDRVIDIPTMGANKGRVLNLALLQVELTMCAIESVTCWLEHAASRPQQSAGATFKQGRTYGNLEAMAVFLGWPVRTVTPAVWKQYFGLVSRSTRKQTRTEMKAASRAHATRMFTKHAELFSRAKDDGRAEAALVALYGAEKMSLAGNTTTIGVTQ